MKKNFRLDSNILKILILTIKNVLYKVLESNALARFGVQRFSFGDLILLLQS
ncbi:MAG: hypothetical protein KAI83_18325 [Thiomargarita sp.]|nr:hypothetical protein [Thiomargarita sp.]